MNKCIHILVCLFLCSFCQVDLKGFYFPPDSLNQKAGSNSTESFFDSLSIRSQRKKWTRELHNIVIRTPAREVISDTIQTQISTDPYLYYGGRIIRNINITKLEAFGPDLYDTTRSTKYRIEDKANNFHVTTRTRVINNHLIFKKGDILDPNQISDNERIIRDLPFMVDARFIISETAEGSDSVDVLLITKDAFSIGLGGQLGGYNNGRAELFEKNLFGYGHELHGAFHWNLNYQPGTWTGTELYYIIHNIGGSFIDSRLRFANIYDTESYQISFDRRFFTPSTRYAGGAFAERIITDRIITYSDTLVIKDTPIKYNRFDLWFGRSFHLGPRDRMNEKRVNLILATRLLREQYIERPILTENTFYPYQNKNVWLNSVGISYQYYFRSNLIYDFGRTEDIPQGMLMNFTIGPEYNEFNRRLYTGVSFSRGSYIGNLGYIYGLVEGGGYIRNSRKIEQGVFNFRMNYFTNLFILNRYKFRHFIDAGFVRGINRYSDEFIYLNSPPGITGFRSDIPRGLQKLSASYEINAFTPFYLYGFRFVLFGFADLGIISNNESPVFQGATYTGFGIGARFRNEWLVFETISIRLGIYPNYPEDGLPLFFDLSGEKRFKANNFYATKPDFVYFR